MSDIVRTRVTEKEPHDHLTGIAHLACREVERQDPEVRAIVLLYKGNSGGIGIHGYRQEGDADAQMVAVTADLLEHARAMAHARGVSIQIVPLG